MESAPATIDYASAKNTGNIERTATFALLLATLFWGCGFTWAKSGGSAANSLNGLPNGAPLGPIWLLAVRFGLAGVLWLIIFPASRRGWTWNSVGRATIAGVLLSAGLMTQHLGLDRASEAITAFLTSLTILFVPLLMMIVLRKPPPRVLWIGVVLATIGVYLMTGAGGGSLGVGESLALACAVLFSMHLISVNLIVAHDTPARMAPGQFLVVAIVSAITCLFLDRGPASLLPGRLVELSLSPGIALNLGLMVLLVTIGAFGLQTQFQPHLDPTRAALLYLCEPVFAAIYAFLHRGQGLSVMEMSGAGLILVANVLVEIIQSRRSRNDTLDAGSGAAIVD